MIAGELSPHDRRRLQQLRVAAAHVELKADAYGKRAAELTAARERYIEMHYGEYSDEDLRRARHLISTLEGELRRRDAEYIASREHFIALLERRPAPPVPARRIIVSSPRPVAREGHTNGTHVMHEDPGDDAEPPGDVGEESERWS